LAAFEPARQGVIDPALNLDEDKMLYMQLRLRVDL